jgi:homoserine O-acetyltransferase/O-succinyltransferase
LRQIAAPLLLVGISTDWLFPPEEICLLATTAADLGQDVTYAEIDSMHGHDAFLKEWSQLDTILRPFMGEQLLQRYRRSLTERRTMATA